MTKKFKWRIQELKCSKQVRKAANLILNNRIDSLIKFSLNYLENPSAENLHDVRIALRRVRYSMELFFNCYDEKIFLRCYNNIQNLQDLSGSVRDVDISIENINNALTETENEIKSVLSEKLNTKKLSLEEQFQKKLKKFLKGKPLKDFSKQIN